MSTPISTILLEDEYRRSSQLEVEGEVIEEENVDGKEEDEEEEFRYAEYLPPDEDETPAPPSTEAQPKTGSVATQKNKKQIRLRHIPSIPNFRALLWDRQRKPVIFRSARQECLAHEDVKAFMEFDIRTIIDLRSCHEYSTTNGDRLLDLIYPVFDVSLPKESSNFDGKDFKCTQVSYNYPDEDTAPLQQYLKPEEALLNRRRLLIPICNKYYLMSLTKEVGGYHLTAVRAVADLMTFFKFGFLTRRFVQHFNGKGQWRLFVSYLEHGANAIVAALKVINEPENLPVLINCHVGKDRTGVLSAILLAIVGVAREDILNDFAHSEDGIRLVRDEIREYMTSHRMYWDEEFLHAFPDDMSRVLEFVDEKYGSLSNFLHDRGFTFGEQARLKENLLVGSRTSVGSKVGSEVGGAERETGNAIVGSVDVDDSFGFDEGREETNFSRWSIETDLGFQVIGRAEEVDKTHGDEVIGRAEVEVDTSHLEEVV